MKYLLSLLCAMIGLMSPIHAASSFDYSSDMLTARLISAEDGVAPTASTLSAGLVIELKDGWKTYWKSPGQVGYPPSIDWSASENVKSVEFQWPAPKRFVAFDIENYGYADAVTHPLMITLETPGKAARLRGSVSLLVCSDICVPQDFDLSVGIPEGTDIDMNAASLIAEAAAKVPVQGALSQFQITSVILSPARDLLTVAIYSETPMTDPTVFVDMGLDAAFGTPSRQISGTSGTISLPVLALPEDIPLVEITLVDRGNSAVFAPEITIGTAQVASTALAMTLVLAFIGGLILNVMPCVLPVLSIKFASALKSTDQSLPRIRSGFLVSALGVLVFMWSLALVLIAIRASGGQIGWGIQFQSPIFLSIMVLIMMIFAANLGGLFEISLPQNWTTGMARAGGGSGLAGDFATGALAAVMATPCSAPFLGTAVAVALAGSNLDTMAIFTALGLGLALPYILVAIRPQVIQKLPKPGTWMNSIKLVLAGLMAATCLWLLAVLATVIGTIGVGIVVLGGLVAIWAARGAGLRKTALVVPVLAIIAAPIVSAPTHAKIADPLWTKFDQAGIQTAVADGKTVFVDVTAAWCLTCKANKSLVLDRPDVWRALRSETVIAMQADWTRPDPEILAYLQTHGRYGIPFNMVYGPGAPDGLPLPEILTTDTVMTALAKAGG